MGIGELMIRQLVTFSTLFVLTRLMGRKEISQMTFFNFTSAIAIGSIAANISVNFNIPLVTGILALAGWALFTLIMGYIDIKSKKARKITTGEPIVVIKGGKIMENSLRSTRLDMDAFNSLLRQSGIFSLKDVQYAVFETSGYLSVLKKDRKQPVTKEDMNVKTQPSLYPASTEVISDGYINSKNLSRLNRDQQWLMQEMKNQGVQNLSEVFYAEIQQDGSLYIDHKDDRMRE
ncbi:DUF421 domain-containing protein [Bacillus lacus]|uniref:DUF421 domain-containing protein n=1 Tax=Metabacillus lacus TaxID=1983721 RepID=A0A7X2IY87_9BACI|nr:DUF421 domain-containing protein [Metabacillus lacus]MRX72018.1 DUF421 domain-containing protein [Metabacillus lacus]